MLIAVAGMPGVGKTTLATALAARMHAVLLNKDDVRAAHFGRSHVDDSVELDDQCRELMYHTTEWLVGQNQDTVVILDGDYTRADHIATLEVFATDLGKDLFVNECALRSRTGDRATEQPGAAWRPAAPSSTAPLVTTRRRCCEPGQRIRLD